MESRIVRVEVTQENGEKRAFEIGEADHMVFAVARGEDKRFNVTMASSGTLNGMIHIIRTLLCEIFEDDLMGDMGLWSFFVNDIRDVLENPDPESVGVVNRDA